MVSEKGDVTSTDTINRGYVWASTNTTTKSRSGFASTDYNQTRIQLVSATHRLVKRGKLG